MFTMLILFTSTGAATQNADDEGSTLLTDLTPFADRAPPTPMPQTSGAPSAHDDADSHVAA